MKKKHCSYVIGEGDNDTMSGVILGKWIIGWSMVIINAASLGMASPDGETPRRLDSDYPGAVGLHTTRADNWDNASSRRCMEIYREREVDLQLQGLILTKALSNCTASVQSP